MADIQNDVYSIEFDGKGFESQVQNLIAQIQQLDDAMVSAQESGADFDEIQGELSGTVKKLDSLLSGQVSTVQGLNQKQQILTKTQGNLNSASSAYGTITKANVQTTNQLSTAVATNTRNAQGLGRSLINGARQFNSLRRAAQGITSVFRLLGGLNPLAFIAGTALPYVIGLFGKLIGKTKETKSELDKLDDPSTGMFERQQILEDEIARLDSLKRANGELTEEQKKQRDELVQKYNETNKQIEESERKRIQAIFKLESQIQRARIKLLGNTAEAVAKTAEQDTAELFRSTGDQILALQREVNKLLNEEQVLISKGRVNAANAARVQAEGINDQIQKLIELQEVEQQLIEDEKQRGLVRLTQNQILSNSLAALESELSRLQKLQREQTAALDLDAQKSIQSQIDLQLKRVQEARKLLADLQGVADAEIRINKRKIDLIEDDAERQIAVAKAAAAREIENVTGSEEQKALEIELINLELQRKIGEIRQKSIDDAAKATEEEAKKINEARQKASESELQAIISTEERKLSVRLQAIEKERNAALVAAGTEIHDAEQRNKAVEAINKDFDARRVALEKETQRAIIQARIAAAEATIKALEATGESAVEQKAEVEKLRLELEQLGRTDPTVKVEVDDQEAKDKLKKLIGEVLAGVQQVSDQLFSFISQQFSQVTQRLTEAVNTSRTALDNIRQNSEDFNADQLALEKQRLQELEAARAQAAQREQAIALIQVAANSAVAIAKAAAEGGVAAPFTIASTLIALIAGFASARNAASGAFYHGTEYLERNGAPKGRDTIHIRAHEGERIVPTSNNMKYYDAYSAFQNERIPASVANMFANGYMKGGIAGAMKSLQGLTPSRLNSEINVQEAIGGTSFFFNSTVDTSKLEREITELKQIIKDLPRFMPVSQFNIDKYGIYTSVQKIGAHAQMRKNRAK